MKGQLARKPYGQAATTRAVTPDVSWPRLAPGSPMSTFQLNTAELEQLHELLLRFRLERLPSVELDTHVVQTAKAVRRRISRRHAGRDFVAPPRVRRPAAKAVHFGA